jgi:mannose-1-phosphate guanylyltransferase
VQPCNKGTAPAILYTLLQITQMDSDAVVAILPCDHYYSRENLFTASLESAFTIASTQSGFIVLLGARPRAPEVEYGWLEVGEPIGPGTGVFHVTRFHEKPPLPIARRLLESGALWNTFVMVGHVSDFLDLALATVPDLLRALRSVPIFSTSDTDTRSVEGLYEQLDPADFSRQVLSPGAGRLLTLQLGEVEWNDLGDPDRVISALRESGVDLPTWATRWRAARETEQTVAQRKSITVMPGIASRSDFLTPIAKATEESKYESACD